jgi:hypothetical protein
VCRCDELGQSSFVLYAVDVGLKLSYADIFVPEPSVLFISFPFYTDLTACSTHHLDWLCADVPFACGRCRRRQQQRATVRILNPTWILYLNVLASSGPDLPPARKRAALAPAGFLVVLSFPAPIP